MLLLNSCESSSSLERDKISKVLPLVKKTFNVKIYWTRFFRESCDEVKVEAENAQSASNQFTLHCAVVQSGQWKYIYNFNGNTTHDSFFIYQVLTDITIKWSTENETVLIPNLGECGPE